MKETNSCLEVLFTKNKRNIETIEISYANGNVYILCVYEMKYMKTVTIDI